MRLGLPARTLVGGVALQRLLEHLVLIVGVALGAHLVVRSVQALGRRRLWARGASQSKLHTVTGFVSSVLVFTIYFAAAGFALNELGVSLTTYFASATVIGLAVSFGSQGVVQDVITGLTLVFSDLIDVGDMVDLGGQVGIVESVGMRFTVLVSFTGARVFVPNRSITNVINYPKGYIRAYLDARLPEDPATHAEAERRLAALAQASYEQYPGILLLPPTVEGRGVTRAGYTYLRIKFRIWPGQVTVLENAVKSSVKEALKGLDPQYADWMVTVYYRAEPQESARGDKRLPRPSALALRAAQSAESGPSGDEPR